MKAKHLLILVTVAIFSFVIYRAAVLVGQYWEFILAVGGVSALASVLYVLYRKIKADQIRQNVLQAEYDTILLTNAQIEAETKQLQAETMIALASAQLENHINLTRVYPENGYFPALIGDNMQLLPSGMDIRLLPQVSSQARGVADVQMLPGTSVPSDLPIKIRYEDIKGQIPPGHGLLGVSAQGVVTCDFGDFMTMLISGGSNSGKSNTVALKINEAIENGRDIQIILIDWHWRKDDSLYNKIKCYEDRFLMPAVKREEDTLQALEWFYGEFKRRLADGIENERDILLIIDEVSGMTDAEDARIPALLKKIARKCGQETRGFGMFGWFVSQQMIGLSWVRRYVHTVIAHKAVRINEGTEACNGHKDIARDMERWPTGRVAVYGQNLEGIQVLQMATFTPPDNRLDGTRERHTDELNAVESDVMPAIEALQEKRRPVVFQNAHNSVSEWQECQENNNVADAQGVGENVSNALLERLDATPNERPTSKVYRFDEKDIEVFKMAYSITGSVDKALGHMHKGKVYRQHASEIIQAHGLRKA